MRVFAFSSLACLLIVLVFLSPFFHDWRATKVTRSTLPNGDQIIERLTPGSAGLFESGSPTIQLYVRWHETNSSDLFYTGPANFYTGAGFESRHDLRLGVAVVLTSEPVFWRPDGDSQAWREWSFMTPNRQPLYDYLKTYTRTGSNFREIEMERGKRLELQHESIWIGDSREQTWNLPYKVIHIDFEKNILTAELSQAVPGLPSVLVFSGPEKSQGGWEFDADKTSKAGSVLP